MNIGIAEHGLKVNINLERLIESRLLVQANSGAGKSWALRRILEQSYGKVQQIVIDVEDEFYTLREKFDYVLAGRQGGDCPADVRSATLLARRLLELGTSAIIGIYELKSHDRIRFVRLFLESMVAAPRSLWHPVLVVIDECHIFAPEKGHGEAESAQAVIDLMTLGRKRGFCGIPATQRISKLHKDVCEVNNKLIGRSALDVDMKRAARELGFSSRDQELELRSMRPGEFFAFGPAISDVVVKVKVGPVETTHPKSGQQIAPPPPPREKVRAVLSQLADLPKEAEKEALTVADLKKQIRTMETQMSVKGPSPEDAARIKERAIAEIRRDHERRIQKLEAIMKRFHAQVSGHFEKGVAICESFRIETLDTETNVSTVTTQGKPSLPRSAESHPETPPYSKIRESNHKTTFNGNLTGPEQRILDAIAWMESLGISEPEQTAVAFLADYTYGGGGFNNPRGALNTKGLVRYVSGNKIALSDQGREAASFPSESLTAEELQRRVLARLPGPESKILQTLIASYPDVLTNQECADRSGYTNGGGGYNNPRGRLRTLGLIEYMGGGVRAKDLLFLK